MRLQMPNLALYTRVRADPEILIDTTLEPRLCGCHRGCNFMCCLHASGDLTLMTARTAAFQCTKSQV